MKLLDGFLNLLFPPKCLFCHRLLSDDERDICASCANSRKFLRDEEGRQVFENVDSCFSPLYYEDDVRNSLLRYKFSSVTMYAPFYANLIVSCSSPGDLDCDLITWVPLSSKRLRQRGYDQAELIARQLSMLTGIECVRLLKKVKNVSPQSLTGNHAARKKNIENAYSAVSPWLAAGNRILIIDDIVTTGATLSECAGVLKGAGALSVRAATVARRRD